MAEVCEHPPSEALINKVLDVVADVEDINTIAGYLNQAFYQYTIDQQRKEQHYGI